MLNFSKINVLIIYIIFLLTSFFSILNFQENKIIDKKVNEIIFALSATIEADTTSFYLFKILNKLDVKVSVLARGIPVGDQLEYTDEVTLARSIQNRRPYESNISNQ